MDRRVAEQLEIYFRNGGEGSITCRAEDLKDVAGVIVKVAGAEQIRKFRRKLIKNLIRELQNMSSNKTNYSLFKGQGKLRDQIIDDIKKNNRMEETFDNDLATRGLHVVEGEWRLRVTITHPLAQALEDGTGIYNPFNPHIIYPAKRKYMFIPGMEFKKSWDNRLRNPTFVAKRKAIEAFYSRK